MSFIQIVDPTDSDGLIRYSWFDDEKNQKSESVLLLKVLTPEKRRRLEKKHTERVFNKKARSYDKELDTDSYVDDVLDAGLVGWENVKFSTGPRKGEPVPCERLYKLAMPERIKVDLMRIVSGKELDDRGEGEDEKKSGNASASI